jgi:hypothetical protein
MSDNPSVTLFHAHLDVCRTCATQPMGLCYVGARLLRDASDALCAELPSIPVSRR